jgi:hypothetical protein
MSRRRIAVAAVLSGAFVAAAQSATATNRVDVGHGLSFAVPPGWRVSHHRFTPCTDPVERVSLIRGDAILMLQERLDPARAELSRRPAHFAVSGEPAPMACCSVGNRRGWSLQFGDRGRGFYASIYPGHRPARELLALLDTLHAR